MSIPADGRWDRYPTPEAVCGLLDTIAWAGFNSIKVDVKPVVGYCEFESSYLEPMRMMKTQPFSLQMAFSLSFGVRSGYFCLSSSESMK